MKAKVFIFSALCVLATQAYASDIESVAGTWKTHPGDDGGYLHVRFASCAEQAERVCGEIVGAYDGAGKQDSAYEHLGKLAIRNMVLANKNQWNKGALWNPENNKSYRGGIQLIEKSGELKVSGCISIFCESHLWQRVK